MDDADEIARLRAELAAERAAREAADARVVMLRGALGDLESWLDVWVSQSLNVAKTADDAMDAIEAARAALADPAS